MEIFQLHYAETLAKYCSFTLAAESLFITQPSLSQQIQNLERELGFSIFYRNKKEVKLTYAGEQFIKDAKKVILEYEKLEKSIQRINESMSQTITFGTSSMSSILIARSIKHFLKSFPKIDFKLVEAADPDLVEMVKNHELNLAYVIMPENHCYENEMTIIPLKTDHLCVAATKNHKLARQTHISLEDLEDEELLFSSPKSILLPIVLNAFKETYTPKNIMYITSIEARVKLIMDGAISPAISTLNMWDDYQNVTLVPIKPFIYIISALIYPADRNMSFIENSLTKIISADFNQA